MSRLNRAGGRPFEASAMMIEQLEGARAFYGETGGLFDPTILGSLEAVGYDRDFDLIAREGNDISKLPDRREVRQAHDRRPRFEELRISGNQINTPAGFRIDLGGIGKGYIVDYLVRTVFADESGYLISAGGDLAAKGTNGEINGWAIGVQDPHMPDKDIFTLYTKGGSIGVATSGILKRRGGSQGHEWHHMIDPRTGEPVENDVLAVTAVSTNATRADIYAKTVLLLGAKEGIDFIEERPDSAGIIFTKDGETILSSQTGKFIKQ